MPETRGRLRARLADSRSPRSNGVSKSLSRKSVASVGRKATKPRAQKRGFRYLVALFGSGPMLWLLTVTPLTAYMNGLLKYPDILISDVIACSPWHRSVYSTGISMAALSSCVIYSEFVREIKRRISLLPKGTKVDKTLVIALDQFLFVVFSILVPNLLILISFMFEEASNEDGSVTLPDGEEFFQWLLHIVAATLAFAGLGLCGLLYAVHIGPLALKLGVESEQVSERRSNTIVFCLLVYYYIFFLSSVFCSYRRRRFFFLSFFLLLTLLPNPLALDFASSGLQRQDKLRCRPSCHHHNRHAREAFTHAKSQRLGVASLNG